MTQLPPLPDLSLLDAMLPGDEPVRFPVVLTPAEVKKRPAPSYTKFYIGVANALRPFNMKRHFANDDWRLAQRVFEEDGEMVLEIFLRHVDDKARGGRKHGSKNKPKAAPKPTPVIEAPKPAPVARASHDAAAVGLDERQKLIYLMQAFHEGAVIEELHNTVWLIAKSPNWMLPTARLRIQPPPPRTLFVVLHRNDPGIVVTATFNRNDIKNADPACVVEFEEAPS